jgi:hypothetical protein
LFVAPEKGDAMARRRIREVVWEPPSPHYLLERARKGWTLVALEWEREADPDEALPLGLNPEVPYGLQVAADGRSLEEDPEERQVLIALLNLIVKDDVSFSQVARELNEKGLRTREGNKWTQTAVFEMLPRMVEVAPTVFSSREWEALKQRI